MTARAVIQRLGASVLIAVLAACSTREIVRAPLAVDPTLLLRVAVVKNGPELRTWVLSSSASLSFVVDPAGAEVWELGYSAEQLGRAFPALRDRGSPEIARLFQAVLTPGPDLLGPPARVLRAEVPRSGSEAPLLESDMAAFSAWLVAAGLSFSLEVDAEAACSSVRVKQLGLPLHYAVTSLAAVSDDRAYFIATDSSGGEQEELLGLYDSKADTMRVIERRPPRGTQIAFDVDRQLLYEVVPTSTAADWVRALDEGGAERALPAPPIPRPLRSWALAVDGSFFITDGQELAVFSGGAWSILPPPKVGNDVTGLVATSLETSAVQSRPYMYLHNRMGWHQQFWEDATPHWASADEEQMVVLTYPGELLMRSLGGADFEELSDVPVGRWVVALAGGRRRVTLAGSNGELAVRLNGGFCSFSTDKRYGILRGSAPLHGSSSFLAGFNPDDPEQNVLFFVTYVGTGR